MLFEFIDGTLVRIHDVCCFNQRDCRIEMLMKSGRMATVTLDSECEAILEFNKLVSELRPDIEELGTGLVLLYDMIVDVKEISAVGKSGNQIFLVSKNGDSMITNYPENNITEVEKDFDKIKKWMRK